MIYKIQLTYAVATETLRDAQEAAMLHYTSLYARSGDDPNGLPAMGALYDVQVTLLDSHNFIQSWQEESL